MVNKKKLEAEKNRRVALIVSMCIMAIPVLYMSFAALSTGQILLLLYVLPYAVLLALSWLRLQGKIQSETLRRIITLFNILGAASVLLLAWGLYELHHTLTF